jgi:hypothetical protein
MVYLGGIEGIPTEFFDGAVVNQDVMNEFLMPDVLMKAQGQKVVSQRCGNVNENLETSSRHHSG